MPRQLTAIADQYKEWFYVNIYTKKSQWERPTEPVYPPPSDGAPPGPPPGYDHNSSRTTGPEKGGLGSNNPYGGSTPGSSHNASDDEALARKLQAEEEARARGGGSSDRGAADSYYSQGSAPQYGQGAAPQYGQGTSQYGSQELPPRDRDGKKGGFLGKLLGKASGGSHSASHGYPAQQQAYYQQGPPQRQYGYAPQQGYYGQGGYPPQGGYYPQAAPAGRTGGGGMGMGGIALGAGAGLLGGALIADAIDDHEDAAYQQGYDQGVSDPISVTNRQLSCWLTAIAMQLRSYGGSIEAQALRLVHLYSCRQVLPSGIARFIRIRISHAGVVLSKLR